MHTIASQTSTFICHPPQVEAQSVEEPAYDYSRFAFQLPDNETFVECMSGLLKQMHEGYDKDPNLKGLLLPPPPPSIPSQRRRRRSQARTLRLEDAEEEIIKQEERVEFQRVLEADLADVGSIQPLSDFVGTQYDVQVNLKDSERLMAILLQYQTFKSFLPYYTDDETVQQEQIKQQKQTRHELMKKKRAIRRERRKEMKSKKRGLSQLDGNEESNSKRGKYEQIEEDCDSNTSIEDDDDSGEDSNYSPNQVTRVLSELNNELPQWNTSFDMSASSNPMLMDIDLFLSPSTVQQQQPPLQLQCDVNMTRAGEKGFDLIFDQQLVSQQNFGSYY
jgi:hypothetical protein